MWDTVLLMVLSTALIAIVVLSVWNTPSRRPQPLPVKSATRPHKKLREE